MLSLLLVVTVVTVVGPPAPQDRLQVLRSWQGRQQTEKHAHSPYPLLMLADAISTESVWAAGWADVNPVVNAAPGRVGRVVYFAVCAWGLSELEKRLPRWATTLLRAWLGGVEERMLMDNQHYQLRRGR